MKLIVLVSFLIFSIEFCQAQLPAAMQTNEMKQMLAELKKEISALELDIKIAEKEDPESVASMRTQLATYKQLLQNFEKPVAVVKKPETTRSRPTQTTMPVTVIKLSTAIVSPTAAQSKDLYFGFRGRKINDSTLIAPNRTLVQYSKRKQLLIIQPDEKKDSFLLVAKEIARGEQRKTQMIEEFDRAKNGFIYYPYLTSTLLVYDDITVRYSSAINNTVSLDDPIPSFAPRNAKTTKPAGKGPVSELIWDSLPNASDWVLGQLKEVESKISKLPAPESIPAPSPHELGRCATCDQSLIKIETDRDKAWIEAFTGRERVIFQQLISAMRAQTLEGDASLNNAIYEQFSSLKSALDQHIVKKEQILLQRYGDQLQYLPVILPVILGNHRQRQLLGSDEGSGLHEIVSRMKTAYQKYYREQLEARNHDFILNVPFHLGVYRQMALLGGDDGPAVGEFLDNLRSYNRFALTLEMDFIWQRDADGKLERRATGNLQTRDKVYVWLFPDSCGYRLLAHGTDLSNKKFEDITLPMKIMGGVKTVRESEDRLTDYPYTGAPELAFKFPDCKIDFCDGGSDTLFFALIGGNAEVAARAEADMQNIRSSYTIELLLYAAQSLINENEIELAEGTLEAGNKILSTINSFTQAQPENTLDKLRIQYTGYMQMDDQRKLLENAYSSKTARIIFNAANRSSVLTDTYLDTHRKLEDDVEIKKGLFHIRIVHEPE